MRPGTHEPFAWTAAPQVATLRCDDPTYPARLRALELAPALLHLKGRWDERLPAVAIVGARAASSAAQRLSQALAEAAVGAGCGVVSGGAIGVDAAAHRGALLAQGRTCVVLGTGIDVAYPQRHAALFSEVVERGGGLLSCFPLGTPPKPWHFPARNRLIAALADAVVIVEAALQSGSLSTAEAALRLGRPLLCVPGSPGADLLLCQGATPVRDPAELLARLRHPQDAGRGRARPVGEMEDSPALRAVRGALDRVPRDLSELSLRAGLAPAACAAAVMSLELDGACLRMAGGRYISLTQAS